MAQVILGADTVSSTPLDRIGWIDISQAVEAPRVHDQLFPLEVDMDSIFDQARIDALQARGHNTTGKPYTLRVNSLDTDVLVVSDINRIAAVVQAVMAKDGDIFGRWLFPRCSCSSKSQYASRPVTAASDSRKNGIAAGY